MLAPINQIRLAKRMYLPFELVVMEGIHKTKEFCKVSEISCIKLKFKIEKVPSPSNKTKRIQEEFIIWMKEQ